MVYRVKGFLRQWRNTKRWGIWLLTDLEQNKIIESQTGNRFIDISFLFGSVSLCPQPLSKNKLLKLKSCSSSLETLLSSCKDIWSSNIWFCGKDSIPFRKIKREINLFTWNPGHLGITFSFEIRKKKLEKVTN